MAKRLGVYAYDLEDGNTIVYRGMMDDLETRSTHIRSISDKLIQETAKEILKTYRDGYDGKNPKYNKDSKLAKQLLKSFSKKVS